MYGRTRKGGKGRGGGETSAKCCNVRARAAPASPLQAIAQNRVQQIVITLDKVKHFLRQPGQLQVGACCTAFRGAKRL